LILLSLMTPPQLRSTLFPYTTLFRSVRRIWKQHGLRPHRVSTFKVSRDPRFVEKLTDVVGLYLNPPDQALVLCVDEKSQIQALEDRKSTRLNSSHDQISYAVFCLKKK